MMRMVVLVLATLFLVNGTLHASAPAAPAGATFFDNFSSGSLDTSKWIPSNWGAPGGGTFVPSYLDFSTGMLRIKVTQTYNSSGGIASVGGELQSKQALGFGTYEWVIRASSTSSTPTGSGVAVSGQISSGFVFVNNSQTEIDSPEIEGQNPGTLWWTTWTSVNTKQSTSSQAPFAPEAGFHSYKCLWTPTSINFYVDGVLVSTHTGVVPQTPAFAMINHWGTNSTGWGGLATPNITRYMFVRSFSFIPLSQSTTNPPPPPSGIPAPAVSRVSPTSGTTAGGTPVTITGTGFLAGATVAFGTTAATSVTVASSTSITATTPEHAVGMVNVVVTNTDGQSGPLTNGYTYTSASGGGGIAFVQSNSAPATIQASNSSVAASFVAAQTAGNLNVVVVGWGNTAAINSVSDSRGNTYTLAVGPTSGSGLRQSIYYAKNIAAGSNTVMVTFSPAAAYPDMRILEYSGLDASSPLDKTAGAAGTGTTANSGSATTTTANELIFGAGTSGTRFNAAGSGYTSRMINVYGNIVEDKTVTSTGSYNATATDVSGVWVMQMATFRGSGQGGGPAPTVATVSPGSGTTAGGTPVSITGTGFVAGATVKLGGTAATNVNVVGSTSITATTAEHAAGAVDVVVTNSDAQAGTLTQGFTYTTPSNPAPTVATISTGSGTTAGGTPVSITGTGFVAGATVKLGGTAATNVNVVGSTSITATTAAHAAGAVDVVVTNPDSQSGTLPSGYTYTTPVNPAPTVSTITPVSGTTAGGTAVTIKGTGFLTGATVSLGGTAATGVSVTNSTTIAATTPAHAAGAVNVVVTNIDNQTGTLSNGYTYTSSGGKGVIGFVQSNSGPATIQASNTRVAVAYAAAQTAGDTNIVVVGWGDTTSTISSVTDSKLNTYTPAIGPTTGTGLRQAIYYAKNIVGGSTTVTVTFNQAAAYPDVRIMEYSGLDPSAPLDQAGGAAGTGTTANSGNVTTTAASELIFGAGTSGTKFTAAGTGFTSRMINLYGNIAEDKTVNATGSYNATATESSGVWVMQVATFKAAP